LKKIESNYIRAETISAFILKRQLYILQAIFLKSGGSEGRKA